MTHSMTWEKQSSGFASFLTILSDDPILLNDPVYIRFWVEFDRIVLVSTLSRLEVVRNADTNEYVYRQLAQNGRVWISSILIPANPTQEITMSFVAPDQWKTSEYIPLRAIRDILLELILLKKVRSVVYTKQSV